MPTNRKVIDFKIHNLTEEQFQELKEAGKIDPNAIYCTPDETVANFEAVNARIDETNKNLNTFESGVNETVGVINTTIVNVDKKVDEAIQTEQQHNIEINARVDETVADFEEINTEIEALKDKGGIPLLTPMLADHTLNDISWLNADTFSWQSGDVYKAAYEHLVADFVAVENESKKYIYCKQARANGDLVDDDKKYYRAPEYDSLSTVEGYSIAWRPNSDSTMVVVTNTETPVESDFVYYIEPMDGLSLMNGRVREASADGWEKETIDGVTVYYIVAPDGHKICMQDQEANVQALYEKTGVAWYYILDANNKQFKLPRTKHAFTGLRDSVGGYVEAGLPNIYGYMTNILSDGYDNSNKTHALTAKTASTNFYTPQSSGYGLRAESWTFNASNSNSIYGNSSTVQPPATQMYLYFYVGNFERDAIEQTAGLNAEMFNNKVDTTYVNEQLATKANTDLSNTQFSLLKNNNGALSWNDINMSAMCMPSKNIAIDLTLGASGANYTAPADGYIRCVIAADAGGYLGMHHCYWQNGTNSGAYIGGMIPVLAGAIVGINYAGKQSVVSFKFIYAKGSEHLA